MKRLSFLVVFLLSVAGIAPAHADAELGLGPTGLLEAKKQGFDGSGFEYAVVAARFNLSSSAVRRAISSEACFALDKEWTQKCPNGKITQFGKAASVEPDSSYSGADSLIYSLSGTDEMIAPKSKAHAIRALNLENTFPEALDHAIDQGVTAVFFVDRWGTARRGSEVNCDSAFPEAAKAVKTATELGIALFSEPGTQGDSYGLTFPACLSGVLPVGDLDYSGEMSESVSAGPGLVLAHTKYMSLDSNFTNNQEEIVEWGSVFKALAVIGGVYGALLYDGHTPKIAFEALSQSSNLIDDLIVKNIPVVNYQDASAWAIAATTGSLSVAIQSVVQVTPSELAVALDANSEGYGEASIIGYELFDGKKATWKRTGLSAGESKTIKFKPIDSFGWVRLVFSIGGRTQVTAPKHFAISSDFKPDYQIDYRAETVNLLLDQALPEFSPVERSTTQWPEISDPALELIELDYARDLQVTGRGVTVAIIDDGYQFDHPYLQGDRVIAGLCLEMDESCPNGTNKQVGVEAAKPKIDEETEELNYHGTMVAGTIGGNPTSEATGGIAPEVTFIIARVDLNGSDENGDYVVQALEWIYEHSFDYNIAAVNMSFGYMRSERDQILNGSSCEIDWEYEEIAKKLRSRGVAPVVASGNDGLVQGIGGPACEASAIAVGATDNDGSIIGYSNISDAVNLVAPARAHTSLNNQSFGEGSGTSNATPVVAGAFALAKQLRPDLGVDEVLFAMRQSADLVDDIYIKEIPRINIRKFLDYLIPGSDLDGARPSIEVVSSGLLCIVNFDSKGADRTDLRHRIKGTSTWSRLVAIVDSVSFSNLEADTTFEFEVGGDFQGTILWSERQNCTTTAAQTPEQVQTLRVETRGLDWAIGYVPMVASNGSAITVLNYITPSGVTRTAIPLGGGLYYFENIANQTEISIAFQNSIGTASFASFELPVYQARSFSKTLSLTGFKTGALLATHKTKITDTFKPLVGVTAITCAGYVSSKSSSSFKATLKTRATNACAEVKKFHPAGKVNVKISTTTSASKVGTVTVLASGKN